MGQSVIGVPATTTCGCGQPIAPGSRPGTGSADAALLCDACLSKPSSDVRPRFRVPRVTFEAPEATAPAVSAEPAVRRRADRGQSGSRPWAGLLHPRGASPAPVRSAADGTNPIQTRLDTTDYVLALHHRAAAGRRAVIDHIAVGPAGVYVVDSGFVGAMTVESRRSVDEGEPREDLFVGRQVQSQLLGSVAARVGTVGAVLEDAGLEDVPVIPVLCLLQSAPVLLERHLTVGGVHVVGPRGLAVLTATPGSFHAEQRSTLHAFLDHALPPAPAPLAARRSGRDHRSDRASGPDQASSA